MKKRIILSIVFMVMMCLLSTNVNGAEITDFYTPIDQSKNKPIHSSIVMTVDETSFENDLEGHVFQNGDKIVFNSELSSNAIFEGFQIVNGNPGTDVTNTLATITKRSEFNNNIAKEITFTSEKPIILHSSSAGSLGDPVNGVSHRAFYIRYGEYEKSYPIEYKFLNNVEGVVLQYGGPQIDKAYVSNDFYEIKFYNNYVKKGYHFNYISIDSSASNDFESQLLSTSNGVSIFKTRVKKYYTDGAIDDGKMMVSISMTTGYTLELDANGGKIDFLDSKIFEIENKYTDIVLSGYNTPLREGYTFGGWYTDQACTKPALATTNFDDEVYYERLAEDAMNITYYAKWIPSEESYTITINSQTGFTTDLISPKIVNKNDDLEITITANKGYKLTSVKIDNVEQALPLTNNKILLTDITKNIEILVTTEEITYSFDDNSKDVKYTIGTDEELSLRVKDASIDAFEKVYINDKELDSKHYTVESGSIIVKVKDSYLRTLKNGTYSIKVLTKDGGKATSSFIISNSSVNDESNPDTVDRIMTFIIIGSASIIGLIGTSKYCNKKIKGW